MRSRPSPVEATRRRREAAVPLFSWAGLFSPLFCLLLGTYVLIVLFLPESIAREHVPSQRLTLTVRSTLLWLSPYADIQAHARSTAFPSVAAHSHALLWVSIAILLVFNTLGSLIHWRAWMLWFTHERAHLLPQQQYGVFALLAFLLLATPVFSMMPGSTGLYAHAELTCRWAFAVLGVALLSLWQVVAYSLLPLSFVAISKLFKKRIPDRRVS